MLTLKLITEETERVVKGLEKKHFPNAREAVEKVLEYDKIRRETQQKLDSNKQQQNKLSKQIGGLMKEGKRDEAEKIKAQVAELKADDKALQELYDKAQADMTHELLDIPNIPNDKVPEGKDATSNVVIKEGGVKPELPEGALCHWDLLKKFNLVDFDLGVKITGAGFPVYIGKMARFQRALEAFFLDEARKAGYVEIQPPFVVNEASGYGTGQLPDKEGQMYHANLDNLFLIPTAEVPVTNLFRDEILDEKDLPIKRCAYSACFRREAGSYGKDVRGLNRLHQFDKVEIVRIDTPEHSYQSWHEMLDHVEGLLQKLELPYHLLLLCGGDMSFTSSICVDFETWSAAQKRWLEVSSTSNFESYQANRLHCRFRRSDSKKIELCHTLNGSALAFAAHRGNHSGEQPDAGGHPRAEGARALLRFRDARRQERLNRTVIFIRLFF